MRDFSEQLNFTTATVACANTFREKYEEASKKVAELTGKLSESTQKQSNKYLDEINRMPQQKQSSYVSNASWNFSAYDNPFSGLTDKFIEPLNTQNNKAQPEVQDNKRQKTEETNDYRGLSTLERMRMQYKTK